MILEETHILLPDDLFCELNHRVPQLENQSDFIIEALRYFFDTHPKINELSDDISFSTEIKATITRIDEKYHVKVEVESKVYIHKHPFETLIDAIKLAFKISAANRLKQQYWTNEINTFEMHDKFLIRNSGKKQKAHIWNGLDTSCKMWTTGGLSSSKGYNLYRTNLGKDICTMCTNNFKKYHGIY